MPPLRGETMVYNMHTDKQTLKSKEFLSLLNGEHSRVLNRKHKVLEDISEKISKCLHLSMESVSQKIQF